MRLAIPTNSVPPSHFSIIVNCVPQIINCRMSGVPILYIGGMCPWLVVSIRDSRVLWFPGSLVFGRLLCIGLVVVIRHCDRWLTASRVWRAPWYLRSSGDFCVWLCIGVVIRPSGRCWCWLMVSVGVSEIRTFRWTLRRSVLCVGFCIDIRPSRRR